MFVRQGRSVLKNPELHPEVPARDISYETFKTVQAKTKNISLVATHAMAITASKAWARTTHHVGKFGNRVINKVEERIKKHETKNASENRPQSIFLTTIKAYKHEIKKLNGAAQEELPRPRSEVDLSEKDNNIEESK
jgi:hypothetical protein